MCYDDGTPFLAQNIAKYYGSCVQPQQADASFARRYCVHPVVHGQEDQLYPSPQENIKKS